MRRNKTWVLATTTAEQKWQTLRVGLLAEQGDAQHRVLFFACPEENDDGVDNRRRIIEDRLRNSVGLNGASIEYTASEHAKQRVMKVELRDRALGNYLNLEREHDKTHPIPSL